MTVVTIETTTATSRGNMVHERVDEFSYTDVSFLRSAIISDQGFCGSYRNQQRVPGKVKDFTIM